MVVVKDETLPKSLIGETYYACITAIHHDSYDCDLYPLAALGVPPSRPSKATKPQAKGRLYFRNTDDWNPQDPLRIQRSYTVDSPPLPVLIIGRSQSAHFPLYILNQRRAGEDITEPQLTLDDAVRGTVVNATASGDYVLQLDYRRDFINTPGKRQPDLEVFLPRNWLPTPKDGLKEPLTLAPGDPVIAQVVEVSEGIGLLAQVSVIAWANYWLAELQREGATVSAAASMQWRRSKTSLDNPDNLTTPLLHEARLLLTDDDEDTLTVRCRRLTQQGAEVVSYLAKASLPVAQVAQEVLALAEENNTHLFLLDHCCPQASRGIAIAGQVCAGLASYSKDAPKVVLCGSAITEQDLWEIQRQLPQLSGVLLRPMDVASVAQVLQGRDLRQKVVPLPSESVATETIEDWLTHLYRQQSWQGLALGYQRGGETVHWAIAEGALASVKREVLKTLLQQTELRLLCAEGEISLDFSPEDSATAIHPEKHYSRWWRFELQGQALLVGVTQRQVFADSVLLEQALRDGLTLRTSERQLTQLDDLVSAGVLMKSLSHEIHNSMAGLINVSQHLLPEVLQDEVLQHTQVEPLAAMLYDGVQHLDRIVEDVMSGFARHNQWADLQAIHPRLQRLVEPLAREFDFTLFLVPPPALHLPLPEGVLLLALVNLIHNSGKHSKRSHGSVVRVSWDLKMDTPPSRFRFIVDDTGGGINHFQQRSLFRFAHSAASQAGQRHGLGLWFSRLLLEKFGGSCQLAVSACGIGCRFLIEVPLTLTEGHE